LTRERTLAERVASIGGTGISGRFMRHAAPGRDAFAGGYGGRWGAALPVIYLGRPHDSCVELAYRHLVDEAGVPAHLVKARTLYLVNVEATNILDLRSDEALAEVGLTREDLESPVGDYEACQCVAAVAHQLEYHGLIADAATQMGETLALFRQRVGVTELPVVVGEDQWIRLPPRPGTGTTRLSVVRD
jgi:hypothetical protein